MRGIIARGIAFIIFIACLSACTYEANMGEADEVRGNGNREGKTGGWGESRNLITGQGQGGKQVQADFAQHGWDAGVFTVQFGVDVAAPTGNQKFAPPVCEAQIAWSVNGNTVYRRVSVGNGVAISGDAEAVAVTLIDKTIPNGAALDQLGLKYSVTVLITPGERATYQNPPILYEATVPEANHAIDPGGGFRDYLIPEDAGAIAVFVPVNYADLGTDADKPMAITVAMCAGDSTTPIFLMPTYDPRTFQWVPLAPGTTFIRIGNNTVAEPILAVPQWGIQG